MTESNIPSVGRRAPSFALPSSLGGIVKLGALKGKTVVLFFYPKDLTPGCTIEAREFTVLVSEFEKRDAVVLGVSTDSIETHCKFSEKHGLGFPLLTDTDHVVAERYGVWVEKNMYGKKRWGIQRATFLINRDGRLAMVWPKVKPAGHAATVLGAVDDLTGGG